MTLPLLQFASGLYPETDFSKTAVIACQHLLGTTIDLFQEAFKKGLSPANVYLLGKCYSTNASVVHRLRELGVRVSPYSDAFDSDRPYDDQFREYVASFIDDALKRIDHRRFDKVLLLDDGGFVISYVNESLDSVDRLVGIEQTSSGVERLKKVDLRFPTINVARSKAKLEVESPFIARRVVEKLKEKVRIGLDTKVLVVGQGSVGRSIKSQLQSECIVNGCDNNKDFCDFNDNYRDQLSLYDVVIGATGSRILSLEDCVSLKKDVVLVSASSSDREFPSDALRRQFGENVDCHTDIEVSGIRLLNCGFPINFDGREHSLPPEQAQLTRALLFQGLCEALAVDGAGLHALSGKQDQIVAKFQEFVQ